MVTVFLPLLILSVLLLPFFLVAVYFNLATFSFTKLGLSPQAAFLLLIASLVGSHINIPLSRYRTVYRRHPLTIFDLFFYYPPAVREHVIAVNVGGAVIPTFFSLWLLMRTPLLPALAGIAVIALVAKAVARPVPGVGIAMPAFFPPIMAAGVALLIGGDHSAAVAYIAGTLGTLIGADLLNLRAIRSLNAQLVSIGGAGVFDGVFLVGFVAALLS